MLTNIAGMMTPYVAVNNILHAKRIIIPVNTWLYIRVFQQQKQLKTHIHKLNLNIVSDHIRFLVVSYVDLMNSVYGMCTENSHYLKFQVA